MTATAVPSALALTDAVHDLLVAGKPASLGVYVNGVDTAPPADDRGVVQAYLVLHPGPGHTPADNLAGGPSQLLWGCHVTCAGGDYNYCGFAVGQARRLLDGTRLTVDGATVGLLRPPFGANPPPMRAVTEIDPPRVMTVLEFQLLAVPA